MSGPKVVRIVTREEILEICHGLLARVDAALAEWTRIGQRNDSIDDEALQTAQQRRAALAALISADRFTELQKQAPIEEAFLREDIQARLAKVAVEQAAARSRGRREREAAAALLRSLRSGSEPIAADLELRLERGEPSALAEGFQILASRSVTIGGSQDLAQRLRDDVAPRSLSDWLAARPAEDTDPTIAAIDLRIAELSQLVDTGKTGEWHARLDEAVNAEAARRGLLLDGLDVATGRALTEARRRAAVATDFELLAAELEAAGLETGTLRGGLDAIDSNAITSRISQARATLEAHREKQAAASRRAAVLEGLAGLGYEVTEGMRTSWAQDGKMVLRSAARPEYGVEVNAAGERMQMRPVAFDAGGAGPDTSRDRDAETIWCGDVSALQGVLGKAGGGLMIEKSLPIGATPLKRILVERASTAGASEAPVRRERTLR